MNIDYSQFYVGTSSIKSYGSSEYKKDTLVKYEFKTTDEHGNKIMDKMSKEETLQAMKDIRSQYGDNVIVEFSGDGMAALVENRKGLADEAVTDEQRAARAERDTAFANEIIQNEHKEVAPKLSSKAQKLLEKLSAQYGNINFMVGDSRNARELMRNSGKEYSVLFTAEEIEKMASDDSYKEEMLNKAERLIDFSNRINEKYGFTSIANNSGNNAGGNAFGSMVSKYGLAVDSDGTVTFFAELMNKAKGEKTWLQASSEDELLNMIEQSDWSKTAAERKIVFKED